MSRRVWVLAGGVVALALLRAALWVSAASGPGDAGALLLQFDPAELQAIEIARGDAPGVRLERRGEAWVLASAGDLRANPASVEELIARLWSWRVERRAGSDALRHAEFGVDRASARRIRLLGAADLTGLRPLLSEVWIGRVTGAAPDLNREQGGRLDTEGLGLFVRARRARTLESEPGPVTYVVSGFASQLFEAEAKRWILRPLIPGAPDELVALDVREGGRGYRVAMHPLPAFAGEADSAGGEAAAPPLDPVPLRRALNSLYLLRGLGPGPDPPPDALALTLVREDGSRAVSLWEAEGRWFLSAPGLSLESERSTVEVSAADAQSAAALREPSTLRRTRLAHVPMATLRRVRWREAGREWSLERARSGWSLTEQREGAPPIPGAAVIEARVAALAAQLEGLALRSWEAEPESGDSPSARVELNLMSAQGEFRFLFGERVAGRGVALRSPEFPGRIARVDLADLSALRDALTQLAR